MSVVNVKDPEALAAMRSALLQFKSDAADSLYAMQAESRRTIEWLQERQRHWQKALQHRGEMLRQARADLADFQSDNGDCSREAAIVQRIQRAVDEAEQQLRNVQLHLKRVCHAHEEFEREARHLTNVLGKELLQGTALLERSVASLASYTGSESGNFSNGVGSGSGSNIQEASSPESYLTQEESDQEESTPETSEEENSPATTEDEKHPTMPDPGFTKGQVDWIPENAHMSPEAKAYNDGALGARVDSVTGTSEAPELSYQDTNGNVRPVRFDGQDGDVMIDRKLSVTTFPKSQAQALRQSEALSQNGLTGRWEVPTQTEATRALKMFVKLDIKNIGVKVVPFP
jgi:hypothetical protein